MVTRTGTNGNNRLVGTAGADILRGLGGNDTLLGLGGNDRLYGGDGNDSLAGGDGNDLLDPGLGSDTVDGGNGSDTISFALSGVTSGVSVYLYSNYGYADSGYKTLVSIENIIGSEFNDTLYGDALANRIEGGAGADYIHGQDGNDRLFGGAGNDTMFGGEGNDLLNGGAGNDSLSGDNGNDRIFGGAGDDTLDGGYGDDLLNGGSGNDSIRGSDGQDTLIGHDGDDTLDGGYGNDLLDGGAGNDVIYGGVGDDTAIGGAGDDVFIVYGPGNDSFSGGAGSDTLSFREVYTAITASLMTTSWTYAWGGTLTYSSVENLEGSSYYDNLTGNNGANRLSGLGGNDTLLGLGGNDTLMGGLGDDSLDGGAGRDVASYADATVGVKVDLAIKDLGQVTGMGTDTLVGIEDLIDGDFNDTLSGDSLANTFFIGAGNDVINGRGGIDTVSYSRATAGVVVSLAISGVQDTVGAGRDRLLSIENLHGTNFADVLRGNGVANMIMGNAGNDLLQGLGGNDTLNGGQGFDIASYAEVRTNLNLSLMVAGPQAAGSAGRDTLISIEGLEGGSGNDRLTGNAQANLLIGNNGGDRLFGLGGNDTLRGGLGNDTLDGGAGSDTADYSDATRAVTVSLLLTGPQNTGGAGRDTLLRIENITGGRGNDKLTGDAGANVLTGGAGNDSLVGGDGADTLVGGEGNDTLDAGNGVRERLIGGAGDDVYLLGTGRGSGIIEDSLGDHDMVDASRSRTAANINLGTGESSTSGGQRLTLAAGGSSTLPLDIAFLQDLSGSFSDDIATVRGLVPQVISAVLRVNKESAFGAVGFVDKPISPFGSSSDYVYNMFASIGTDPSAISDAFNDMSILSGADGPEAQLEALFQLAKRADTEMGFRSDSMRVAVLFTDANYHVAGDGASAGITRRNDGDADIEGNGTLEDYPSISQLRDALAAAGIFPIFAVTDGVASTYEDLVAQLGVGGVVEIDSASTNVVDAITEASVLATRTSIEDAIGSRFADVITGSAVANILRGGAGNDMMRGLAGSDQLFGDAGNDTLVGGSGADTLTGGAGRDVFVYLETGDSTFDRAGRDLITDFQGGAGDRIDLRGIDANTMIGGNQPFTFIGTANFSGAAGEVRYVRQGGDTFVYADVDGDWTADFSIQLDGSMALQAGFFML